MFVAGFFHTTLQKISGISIGVLCFIMQDGKLTKLDRIFHHIRKSDKGSFTTDLPIHSREHSVTSA
jgi:hypothetical protein